MGYVNENYLSDDQIKSLNEFIASVSSCSEIQELSKLANSITIDISSEEPVRSFANEADTSELEKERDHIKDEYNKERDKMNDSLSEDERARILEKMNKLERALGEINQRINTLKNATIVILGEYFRSPHKIVLYINNIKNSGGNTNWLLVQTFAHELMHAYYDFDLSKPDNYTSFVEEPITELGMLHLMKSYDANVPGIFADALNSVKNKQKCIGLMHYGFGAYLYENELPAEYWIGIMHDAKYNQLNATSLDTYKKPFAQGTYPANQQMQADLLEKLLDSLAINMTDLNACNSVIGVLTSQNYPVTPEMNRRKDRCEEKAKRGVNPTVPYGGSWFQELISKRGDTQSLIDTMVATADALDQSVSTSEPIALIGHIQAGKTRTFIGVIAKCFDLGFDSILVMTQSNVALSQQTELRIRDAFSSHIGRDLGLYNIINNPKALSAWGANTQKNIIIAKKQKHNLTHTSNLLQPGGVLYGKKVLVLDDEADVIGVGYTMDKSGVVKKAALAQLMDDLRTYAKSTCAYLEVTATPYALFLQSNTQAKANNWQPLKPTQVFDIDLYNGYVGGDYFFKTAASQVFCPVDNDEIKVLDSQTSTSKSTKTHAVRNPFTSNQIKAFREALLSYLVAGAIRRCSDGQFRCAQLFNISTIQSKHSRYEKFCKSIINDLSLLGQSKWDYILKPIYDSFTSVGVTWDEVSDQLGRDLTAKAVSVVVVDSNSKNAKISTLLDQNTGQLRLDVPYNIFIGGESICRGVTIDHLISFFYVRKNKNQDTSIQHMRIYGNRSAADLKVTRFYTSDEIFEKLKKMHQFDIEMRNQIKAGHNVVFLHKVAGKISPCAPNKCSASDPEVIGPHHFLLPIGFDTKKGTFKGYENVTIILNRLKVVEDNMEKYPYYKIYETDMKTLANILTEIKQSLIWHNAFSDYKWDVDSHLEAVKRCNPTKVLIYVPTRQTNKGFSLRARFKTNNGTLTSNPMDAPHDGQSDNRICKKRADANVPVVMLLPQDPQTKDGWSVAEKFYWPVITMPSNCQDYVYCKD